METPERALLDKLEAAGWRLVRRFNAGISALPQVLIDRYPEVPEEYARFVTSFDTCVHPGNESWFLGLKDFEGAGDSAFSWDEFERQSLDAAVGDDQWQQEIRGYWSEVLPIALSVRSGYSYLGLQLHTADFGRVVLGREPEFEVPIPVAESFLDLCGMVIEHLSGLKRPELTDFL